MGVTALQGRRRVVAGHAGCLAILGVLGVLLNQQVWLHGLWSTQTLSEKGDVAEQLWFLGVIPHLLFSGHSILHTDLAYAGSGGVNLMANTSIVGPALLLSPFTLWSGPILAMNVGLVLAPVLSGWAMYVLATRFTRSFWLATVAGAFYGFSPALLSHLRVGHFQLTFALVIPLAGVLAIDLLRGTRSEKRTGVYAGLLIILQYSIGAEMLAIEGLTAGVLMVMAFLVHRRASLAWFKKGLKALLVAAPIAGVALVVPVAYELFGPRHFSGAPWANVREGVGIADYVDTGTSHELSTFLPGAFGNLGPDGLPLNFIGFGVLVSVIVIAFSMRRDRRMQLLGGATLLLMIFNWGQSLTAHRGEVVPILSWLPWRVVGHLPVLEQLTVSRVSVAVSGLLAVYLLLGWIHLVEVLRNRGLSEVKVSIATTSVVALALVPLIIGQSFPLVSSTDGAAPPWVTSFGNSLSHGDRVLFLPYPTTPPGKSEQLSWQAKAKFSYEMLGGYLAVPTGRDNASNFLVHATGEEAALLDLGNQFGPDTVSAKTLRLVAQAINHRHPTTVIIVPSFAYRATPGAAITALLGRPPGIKGNIMVWRNVGHATYHEGDAEIITNCVATLHTTNLRAIPDCVLTHGS